jgi:hypothetical protein
MAVPFQRCVLAENLLVLIHRLTASRGPHNNQRMELVHGTDFISRNMNKLRGNPH